MPGQQPITNRFRQNLCLLAEFGLIIAITPLAFSQAAPMNTGSFWTPPGSTPNMTPNTSFPGVNLGLPGVNLGLSPNTFQQNSNAWQQTSNPMMAPSANGRPSIDQTRWYVNNSPYFRNMDPGTKEAIIYSGSGSGLLSGAYLTNGSPNPFYQNGRIIPNWYVPSTYSSSPMNWQGVQQNGYLPNSTAGGYNIYSANPRSTFTANSITPSSSSPTNYTYVPRYTPSRQSPTLKSPSSPIFSPSETASKPSFTAYTPNAIDPRRLANGAAGASALHESADDKVAQAISHAELAHLFLQKDNPDQALTQVEAAEPLAARTGDQSLELDLLWVKAAAQMSSGEFEQAITTYREVMRRLRLQPNQTGQAEAFASMAWAFQSLGKVKEAQDAYANALVFFQRSTDRDGETKALIGMGSLYASVGDSQKALAKFLDASKTATDEQFARILVSYAEILQSQGRHELALKAYDRASLAHHDDKLLNGTIWAGMGRSEVALGSYSEARSHLERAEAEMSAAGNLRGEAGVTASIGELDFWTSLNPHYSPNLPAAAANYEKALDLMRESGDREGEVGVLAGMGQVFEVQGKLQKAIHCYSEALSELEDLRTSARLEEFRIDEANQSENLYKHLAGLQARAHNMEEAFNLSERARARAFLDLLGNPRVDSRQVPADIASREGSLRKENILLERQLGQEFSKPLTDVDQQRVQALQTRLSEVRVSYQQSLDALKAANPSYASFLSVSPLNLKQAQQQLDPDVTSLSYLTLPDMTLAFVVTRDRFHAFKLRATERELGSAVSTLLDFAGDAETTEVSMQLYKMLIAPLKSELKTRIVLISPYGVLHNLPFGALSPDGDEYFADKYSITLLPSISALPYLHARAKTGASSALVMASDDVEGFPYLNGGHSEADAIAASFGVKPLFGEAANVSTLREHGGDYSILHLMAHLDYDSQNPRSSRIVLAQDLNIEDVLDLDLRKADLVVLSGCQSEKGAQTRGDDMIALSRAFMYAGAPSVMASLWSVDDKATEQLMVAFYSHLHDGLSKADALQAAQKDVRRSYPNPYYWAPFELLGDPGTAVASSVAVASKPHM